MKIVEKIDEWGRQNPEKPFFSLEFFPPKTENGVLNLYDRFDRFASMNPLWIDVTWGAGGSTSQRTIEMCKNAIRYHGIEPLMHLTCTNMPLSAIKDALEECKEAGIRNILALRGDPPADTDEWTTCPSGFSYAVDLIKYIKKEYGNYFCIACAGYPEGHLENPDKEDDLRHLKEKVEAGAEIILTQLFYDNDEFISFVHKCVSMGVCVPIIPGIMPIQSYAGFIKMTTFCKTKVPKTIMDKLELIKDDDQKVKDFGVDLAVEMCTTLLCHGVLGLHFYTLNLEVSVMRVIDALNLIEIHLPNRELPWKQMLRDRGAQEEVRPIFWANRARSYIHRTSNWDDFPNGRWGDKDSPAYGEAYFVSVSTNPDERSKSYRLDMWGHDPSCEYDILRVFVNYLRGDTHTKRLPWCSESLGDETILIKKHLLKLNSYGICTINSQPRVNGALSTDPYFGWGPKNGFVFQKAYLEFFCSPNTLEKIETLVQKEDSFSFMAANREGDVISNCEGTVNAVTWGVFPNMEVKQPTVVDYESFLAWRDEAFQLWMLEWGSLYPHNSQPRQFIESITNTWYLVNVVDNNFVAGDLFGKMVEAVKTNERPVSPSPT